MFRFAFLCAIARFAQLFLGYHHCKHKLIYTHKQTHQSTWVFSPFLAYQHIVRPKILQILDVICNMVNAFVRPCARAALHIKSYHQLPKLMFGMRICIGTCTNVEELACLKLVIYILCLCFVSCPICDVS